MLRKRDRRSKAKSLHRSQSTPHPPPPTISGDLHGFVFEIFGQVNGVAYKSEAVKIAKSLNLRGYICQTVFDTAAGEAYGAAQALSQFKDWLLYTGSKNSHINNAAIHDFGLVDECYFFGFSRLAGRMKMT